MISQAVILAGGKGTRLRERLGDLPKPMVDVAGIPLLFRQLRALEVAGVRHAVVLVNHKAEVIEGALSRSNLGLRTTVVNDGEPRGTAGAVLSVFDHLDERFYVVYGDTLFNIDFDRFRTFHENVAHPSVSLFLHPNDHPEDSDLVEIDENSRVVGFHSYPHPVDSWYPNLVNAALYIVDREILRPFRHTPPPVDFAKDLFPRLVQQGLPVNGYCSSEYIKDLGTPERLDRGVQALLGGQVDRASYRHPQRAVFLDRDGTLNELRGHIRRAEDLMVFPFAGPAIRKLNEAEFRVILVSNQPVLARGETTWKEMRRIMGRLDAELATNKAWIDAKYFCPHHPDRGYPGEVVKLKVNCDCRKPQPGLVLRACRDLNVDLSASWFVGDSTTDFQLAKDLGLRSIGLRTGEGGRDGKYSAQPLFFRDHLASAVDAILGGVVS